MLSCLVLATSQPRPVSHPPGLRVRVRRLPRLIPFRQEASQRSTRVASASPLPGDSPLSLFHFPVSLSLLESTLVDLLVSVGNKGLTEKLSFLESTLTRNIGGGGVIVN